MADPNEIPYKARVVATTPYSTEYENGTVLPRDGFAHEDALVFERAGGNPFEGIQQYVPISETVQRPMYADAPDAGIPNQRVAGIPVTATDWSFDSGSPNPSADPYSPQEGAAAMARYEREHPPTRITDASVPTAPNPPVYQESSGVPFVQVAQPTAPQSVESVPGAQGVTPYDFSMSGVVPPMGAPSPANTLTDEQIETRNREQLDPTAELAPAPASGQGVSFVARAPFRVPVAVVPGGGSTRSRTNTTLQEQIGVPIPQELMIQRGQEITSQVASTQALASQHAADAQARADQLTTQLEDQQVRSAVNQQNEQSRQSAMRQADINYNQAINSFQDRAVDPSKWYHDRGTGGTILAAIAMGLGAFAQTLTGGKNTAFDIIQGAISDDIESQKVNIANSREGAVLKGNLLSEMRAQFGDERSAELATEAALTRQAATEASRLEAAAQATGTPIEGDLTSQALRQRATEAEIELRNREATRRTIQTQTQTQTGGGGGISAQARAQARAAEEERALYIPGAVLDNERARHISEGARQKTSDLVAGTARMDDLFREMYDIYQEHGRVGSNLPFAEAKAELASLSNQVMMQLNSNMSLGALDNGTVSLLRTIVPTGTTMDSAVLSRIQNARRRGIDSSNRGLRTNGYRLNPDEFPNLGATVGNRVGAQRGD